MNTIRKFQAKAVGITATGIGVVLLCGFVAVVGFLTAGGGEVSAIKSYLSDLDDAEVGPGAARYGRFYKDAVLAYREVDQKRRDRNPDWAKLIFTSVGKKFKYYWCEITPITYPDDGYKKGDIIVTIRADYSPPCPVWIQVFDAGTSPEEIAIAISQIPKPEKLIKDAKGKLAQL